LHGMLADQAVRSAILHRASAIDYEALIDRTLAELAAHLARHVDLDRLQDMAASV
jgi:hypothetical protein